LVAVIIVVVCMLQVKDITKSFGSQVLFDGCSFSMVPRQRIGLLGRNGHGKSTLFRMILGEDHPDTGSIIVPRGYRVGHLSQHIDQTQPTVVAEAALGLPEEERDTPYRAERILEGLGFEEGQLQVSPQSLSGGYQLRLELAKLLLDEPNLLLLDEPTNYLDIVSVRWLQRELKAWKGEIILVSHDREFMDSLVTHTIAIHRRKLRICEGGTARMYAALAEDDEAYEKTRTNQLKRKDEIEAFAARYRAQASKAKLVQSRLKELDKLDIGEELSTDASLDFRFTQAEFPAKRLMEAADLKFGYSPEKLLFSGVSLTVERGDRIGIIGKNGRGKSTLLKVLVNELTPLSGNIRMHDKVEIGYFGQSNVDRLHDAMTVEDEIASENNQLSRTRVRGICGAMMFSGAMAEKKVRVLSGGERNRVMLGKILARPTNLLFLDEPTNHLDMDSIDSLMEAVLEFQGALLFVTHSEGMLRQLATKILAFSSTGVELFNGTYDEFCDQRGFEEEAFLPKEKKKQKGGNQGQSKISPGISNSERKRLKQQFDRLDEVLQTNEREIERVSNGGDVHELMALIKFREEMEAEQMKLLEQLEG
jgi:ATP-binding cassette subfamily F protein 3